MKTIMVAAGCMMGVLSSMAQMKMDTVNVRDLGARGDGLADDTAAIQKALDSGARRVTVPAGIYRICNTLLIDSGTRLALAPEAVIRLGDGAAAEAGGDCFMIRNRQVESGNENIAVTGGTWDGNCGRNPRGDEFADDSYGGVGLSFMNVAKLTISNVTTRNMESFAIRVGEVSRFLIEEVFIDNDIIRPNQDGIHVGGFSEHGVIRNIRAEAPKTPNDDMVALNADDDVTRHFNRGMKRGPIRNILVENISAPDAYTFVRLLSNTAPIRDVTIRGIRGGCRYYCINLHRWRFPKGGGNIANVLVEDVEVAKLPGNSLPLIPVALSVKKMRIRNLVRTDALENAKTLHIDDSVTADIAIEVRPLDN